MTRPLVDQTLQSLDMRSRDIFRRIVDSFLKDGEPVGSRSLSRMLPATLSPATVRNVMSDLEHLGLVYSPHVSAGRLPTQKGLRFFVDAFMELGDLSDDERRVIEAQIKGIIGLEIEIIEISGKWKVSQNRPIADRVGVANGLQAGGDTPATEMAHLVRQFGNVTDG